MNKLRDALISWAIFLIFYSQVCIRVGQFCSLCHCPVRIPRLATVSRWLLSFFSNKHLVIFVSSATMLCCPPLSSAVRLHQPLPFSLVSIGSGFFRWVIDNPTSNGGWIVPTCTMFVRPTRHVKAKCCTASIGFVGLPCPCFNPRFLFSTIDGFNP